MEDVKGVFILIFKYLSLCSVRVSCIIFSMVFSSLCTTPFMFSVFLGCSIELSGEKSEIHPILDETARYPNHKFFLVSGRPCCSCSPGS